MTKMNLELNSKEKLLAEKYKDTCLMISFNDERTIKQAIDTFNKEHHLKIDYRWCSIFRYVNLQKAVANVSALYKQIIIL